MYAPNIVGKEDPFAIYHVGFLAMLEFDIFSQCTALQWCSFLNMADGAESPAARYNLHKNNPFLLLCAIRIQFMHLMHCTALHQK